MLECSRSSELGAARGRECPHVVGLGKETEAGSPRGCSGQGLQRAVRGEEKVSRSIFQSARQGGCGEPGGMAGHLEADAMPSRHW